MLAIAVTDGLTLIETTELKKILDSSLLSRSLAFSPVSSSWAGSKLYLAASDSIHLYQPASNTSVVLYEGSEISHIVAKLPTTLFFSSGDKIHVLDCSESDALGTVTRTIDSHRREITSLSFSNDFSLLSSTSADAAYVYNLTAGTSAILRGVAATSSQPITTSCFNPHNRTRLLLAVGRKLMIFDATRPTSPVKAIPLTESSQGNINSITCSPFSKTLVAVSTELGFISLIDLEKEKGVFRTVHVDAHLTGIYFAADGACIYAGTDKGELLVLDLRSLDQPPQRITVSQSGQRVQTMSVQSKQVLASSSSRTKPNTSVKSVEGSPSPPSRPRVPSMKSNPAARRASGVLPTKPARSPLRESVAVNANLSPGIRIPQAPKTPVRVNKKSPALNGSAQLKLSLRKATPSAATRRARADVERTRKSSIAIDNPSRAPSASSRISRTASISDITRPRTASSASNLALGSQKQSAKNLFSRPESSASSAPKKFLEVPRTLPEEASSSSTSFDFPEIHLKEPVTPPPMLKKKNDFATLGLGTPLANRKPSLESKGSVHQNGKGKGKVVEFREDEVEDESSSESSDVGEARREIERERSLSVQISPMRPPQGVRASASWVPSPLRQPVSPSPGPSGSAQDFLRGIVRDAMFEYQQETRSELTGLHLDLMRVGRGWKKEMREMMDEYMGELVELRNENKTLREENERLRRGY